MSETLTKAAASPRPASVPVSATLPTVLGVDLFTTGHVCRLLGLAPRTVSKLIDAGLLRGGRIPGSQDRRVYRPDLVRFAAENGFRLAGFVGRPVGVYLPAGWAGLPDLSPVEAGAAAARGDVTCLVVGPGQGYGSALAVGRGMRAACPWVRLGAVVDDEWPPGGLPPGLFDRAWSSSCPPAEVAVWAGAAAEGRWPGS